MNGQKFSRFELELYQKEIEILLKFLICKEHSSLQVGQISSHCRSVLKPAYSMHY